MIDDITGIISGISGGINNFLSDSIIGLIIALQFPIMLIFTALTLVIVWIFIIRRFVLVWPWEWILNITQVIPYADQKIALFQDKGGMGLEDTIPRLKVQKADFQMQKPDAGDVYSNQEILVLSLSKMKHFYARRKVDYKNRKLIIDIENPQVAQAYFIDRVKANNPDWLIDQLSKAPLLFLLWFICGILLALSNLLVVYPLFVRNVFIG